MTAEMLPFIQGRAFDEASMRAMGEAFDKARRMLHDKGQPRIVLEVIAKRIMDLATEGERNPDTLARRALDALGPLPE